MGRRKKGDGLKHGDMGTEKGDFDRDFHFQKEEPTDVVGEIEVDVPKDLLTHPNGSGAKNALLDVLEGAITRQKGVELRSILDRGEGVRTGSNENMKVGGG